MIPQLTKLRRGALLVALAFCQCAPGRGTAVIHDTDDGGTDDAGSPGPSNDDNPVSCAGAGAAHSYSGCDYWPTVTANPVWSVFDFAVVVANGQASAVTITVSGPNGYHSTSAVPANQISKIYLPWVADLKGADQDNCGSVTPLAATVSHKQGAYHLVATAPVTVYQFSALEYAGRGGAPNKNWNNCPGLNDCITTLGPVGCFSFTNDASLLLPSTAMTGNYRIAGPPGTADMGPYFVVTATADGTHVTVKLAPNAVVVGGGGIPSTNGGNSFSFDLDSGDVVEILGGGAAADLSGSLVQATQPVQVITGMPCMSNPPGVPACDHVEESVFPAETLGKHYVVTVPTGPHGKPIGHLVRLYGNINGTLLSYDPAVAGAPTKINAGQVVDIRSVSRDFEVTGDHEFAVASFMEGGSMVDPTAPVSMQEGDPSESFMVGVEQFRQKYIFLSPDDYDSNWLDIVVPVNVEGAGATLFLDGQPLTSDAVVVGQSSFGVVRAQLQSGANGAKGVHILEASAPVGIQVMGYGAYTSYQYPGGLNLTAIAPPPPG